MSERPLVSIVTATRGRPAEVLACIEQVRAQTYRPIEHVIVSDGPDPELRAIVARDQRDLAQLLRFDSSCDPDRLVPLLFAETGRCWSDELAYSAGAVPFLVAQMLAHGPLQMWLSDDEEMDPDHVESLVDLLEAGRNDFVYSRARCWLASDPSVTWEIGACPPTPSQITNALYRTALLDYGTFLPHVGRGTDWHQISRWIAAGARYAMSDRASFRHRADQVGGGTTPEYRQPLRGLGGLGTYAGPRFRGTVPIDESTGRPVADLGVRP